MLKKIRHIENYLTESERKILFFILFVIVCGAILRLAGYTPKELASSELKESNKLALQVAIGTDYIPHYDLNHVTYDELLYISGIGPSTASSILNYQETKGFAKVDDLLNIRGIGQKRLEEWRECFYVVNEQVAPPEELVTLSTKPLTTKPVNTKIDINTATLEQLVTLKGIGPAKAELIIEYRSKHRFVKIEEIKNVKGIGEKTFEKFKDNIYIGE